MKKTLLLFSFITAGIIISNAQPITISQSDVAVVGQVLEQAIDTVKSQNPGSINPGPAGANKTWNFSTLMNSMTNTLTFTNPNWLPNGSNFPNANLAIINSSDGSEIYLENIATGLSIVGAYGDPIGIGAMAVTFNPADQLAAFTATYNSSFQNTSMAEVVFPFTQIPGVDSLKVKETKTKDMKIDGWGKVITPLGTYNCLRQRGMVITIDSIFGHPVGPPVWIHVGAPYSPAVDTVWHFSWWANGVGFPLLEFDSTSADTIRNISWLKSLPVIGGISETASLSGVNVYPNPSAGKFIVESSGEISVYNYIGEKVYMQTSIAGKTEIDLSSQSDGVYFLHIKTSKGIVTKKLIMSK